MNRRPHPSAAPLCTLLPSFAFGGALLIGLSMSFSAAAEQTLTLARGRLIAQAPAGWESVEPASMILEGELSIAPPADSDADPARLTMMAAGGSIDQNVQRWIAQFEGSEGGSDLSAADIKTTALADTTTEVTLVDMKGIYLDGPPRGPKTPRADYRLLGAIVPLAEGRAYFFKLVGPAATVDPVADDFRAMIASLELR
ncbi:hypothetical protein [Botrimarina hoheduenensis]|uniref:PsbP C-terminal domain-containing protein n=1 Tax=Botrimarina hoheduenensis TaxID=2528000 RepID=A0A5C5W9D9_9BACT|nr:hypothetical protein [Botrimarina hoheduenensis]TWT47280.1 hypothetical protein Pla111_08930 [Botrimarina hoheduenensis]